MPPINLPLAAATGQLIVCLENYNRCIMYKDGAYKLTGLDGQPVSDDSMRLLASSNDGSGEQIPRDYEQVATIQATSSIVSYEMFGIDMRKLIWLNTLFILALVLYILYSLSADGGSPRGTESRTEPSNDEEKLQREPCESPRGKENGDSSIALVYNPDRPPRYVEQPHHDDATDPRPPPPHFLYLAHGDYDITTDTKY